MEATEDKHNEELNELLDEPDIAEHSKLKILQRTGHTTECLIYSKGKDKVHRCTGTEALYRTYGP